ncbi:MAG: hypothetical protein ACKO81_07775 [Planctomycetota bacterium]
MFAVSVISGERLCRTQRGNNPAAAESVRLVSRVFAPASRFGNSNTRRHHAHGARRRSPDLADASTSGLLFAID